MTDLDRCEDCGAVGTAPCNTSRHFATVESFARYVAREARVMAAKRAEIDALIEELARTGVVDVAEVERRVGEALARLGI